MEVQRIDVSELKSKLEQGIVLLDVRTREEYAEGHIKGSLHVPLDNLEAYTNKATTYVICHAGMRSMQAVEYLSNLGFDVIQVDGGMLGWNGPIVQGVN